MSDTPDWQITLSDLDCGTAEQEALLEVLRGGWLSMGPGVRAFEQRFAEVHDVAEAVAVSSGTAALHLGLLALDVGPGDEVIQPAINFVAAANMTRAVGGVPRFVDVVSPVRPVIDPQAVEAAIGPRTRAIVALHYGGYPAEVDVLRDIALRHDIALIEDACHAPATRYAGHCLGTWGDVGCFSFFPNKNMTTAEGGMVVTPREDIAQRCRSLRSHGMTTLTWERHRGHAATYDVTTVGFNYRLDELRAALGRVQLERLDGFNRTRRRLTESYRQRLAETPGLETLFPDHVGAHAGHLFVVLVPEALRQTVVGACRTRGIQTSMHYPCITEFSAYPSTEDLPHSRAFSRRAVTLPLHPGLSDPDIEQVCDTLTTVLTGAHAVAR